MLILVPEAHNWANINERIGDVDVRRNWPRSSVHFGCQGTALVKTTLMIHWIDYENEAILVCIPALFQWTGLYGVDASCCMYKIYHLQPASYCFISFFILRRFKIMWVS